MEQEEVLRLVNQQIFEAAAEAILAAGQRYIAALPMKTPEEAELSRRKVVLPLWRIIATLRFRLRVEDVDQEDLRKVAEEMSKLCPEKA